MVSVVDRELDGGAGKEVVPMDQQLLTTLVRDRHQDLNRIAAEVANGRRARDEAAAVERRPRSLRLLDRLIGPR